jgi:hypothetical protein
MCARSAIWCPSLGPCPSWCPSMCPSIKFIVFRAVSQCPSMFRLTKISRKNEVCAPLRWHGGCVFIFYRKRWDTVDALGHWDTAVQLLRFHGNTVSQSFAMPSSVTGTLGHGA